MYSCIALSAIGSTKYNDKASSPTWNSTSNAYPPRAAANPDLKRLASKTDFGSTGPAVPENVKKVESPCRRTPSVNDAVGQVTGPMSAAE